MELDVGVGRKSLANVKGLWTCNKHKLIQMGVCSEPVMFLALLTHVTSCDSCGMFLGDHHFLSGHFLWYEVDFYLKLMQQFTLPFYYYLHYVSYNRNDLLAVMAC